MKVLLVNGSPHGQGCTYTALKEVARALDIEGVETEVFQVGTHALSGCISCLKCRDAGRCVFDDKVNEFLDLVDDADGFVFGSPVHYGSATGMMTSFMDRAFFATFGSGYRGFRLKPAALVVSARRAGTTATLDQLAKYPAWAEMPVISSRYWNMVHGNTPDEVREDLEGMQVMRTLGRNMAWFLKCKEAGIEAGVSLPEQEERVSTDFIRS